MKASFVRARHLLKTCDARAAQRLVTPQRLIGRGVDGGEAGSEGGAVLDCLRGPLSHERVHRMARVAEQGDPADRPARQRLAVEQGPDEARVGRGDDTAELRVPAGERLERPADRRAVGPVLTVPRVVLGPADEIQQPSLRDEVVHEVAAWAHPRLRAELELQISDALYRDQTAIGDAPCEAGRLLAQQRGAHRRVDPVGADDDVGRHTNAVVEPGLHAVALVPEPDQTMTEVKTLEHESGRDDREQIRAVHGQMRRAVELLAAGVEKRALQDAAILPPPLVRAKWTHGLTVERRAEAEPIQDARRVRPKVDAA